MEIELNYSWNSIKFWESINMRFLYHNNVPVLKYLFMFAYFTELKWMNDTVIHTGFPEPL